MKALKLIGDLIGASVVILMAGLWLYLLVWLVAACLIIGAARSFISMFST